MYHELVLDLCFGRRKCPNKKARKSPLSQNKAALSVWALPVPKTNIAKGTTDPRVEFILPK